MDHAGWAHLYHKKISPPKLCLCVLGLCAQYTLKMLWYGGPPGESWGVLASSFFLVQQSAWDAVPCVFEHLRHVYESCM